MAQREVLKTSWVYSLRKEELVNYLVHCGQDTLGTVEEMRKRFVKFITAEHDEPTINKLLEWQNLHDQNSSGSPSVSFRVPGEKTEYMKLQTAGAAPQRDTGENVVTPSVRDDRVATIELIRKWGLKYDGGKDVLKFVDRLEELAGMYEINLSGVVPVMTEMLKDRALIWFRNNHKEWAQWSQFKGDLLNFFLPPRYFERLEEQIRARSQRPRENFKDYVLAVQDLMYHSKLNAEERLEIIFRNSASEYQLYAKRRDFNTLDELVTLAAEMENIATTKQTGRNEHHRMLKDKTSSVSRKSSSANKPIKQRTSLLWEDEKIKATILIDHKPNIALVDTGATRSFVTPSFVGRMRQRPNYLPTDVAVVLADGSKKQIAKAVQFTVTFGNRSKDHEFLIMEEATEAIILGLDFLRSFNTTIQCAGLSAKCKAIEGEESENAECQNKVRTLGPIKYLNSFNIECEMTTDELRCRINNFLEEELPKFQKIKGLSSVATHRIVMKDDRPIKIRYAPRNPAMQAIIDEEVNSLLAQGCIEPSRSPYSFPITLVKKKNGTWRTCMDFRQLNARSIPDAYPLPRIDTILDRLRNAKYISSLDLKNGYWQIPMEETSKKYTAFAVTGRGLYQWRVMPFGLHSAPATFQRALDSVIGPEMEPHAFAYLDDIIVIGKTFQEHMKNLKEVFRRLRAANLKINVEKCEFFKSETRYLGHVVTSEGIKTDPDKIAAIIQLPVPQDTKGVRRFLGITSWYRRFVPNFAKLSQPLTQLLKKGKHWKWGQEQQEAFEALKNHLTNSPVLACPDFSRPFTLQTDASDHGLGAVLTQESDGAEHVIAYASRHLNGAEKNYSATEKECLAIVWGIRKMRAYLEGYEFRVVTDHLSLKWLNSIDNPTGRLARWALELQQYRFSISYRKGNQNVVADALSRNPAAEINLAQVQPTNPGTWYTEKFEAVQKNSEQHADYAIVNNQLYRHFSREINDEDFTPWKLCVPAYQRQQVLMENHDSVTGGHMGVRRTLHKVASRYYWPGMARDVGRYVRNCGNCQRYKVAQLQPAGEMLSRLHEEPWSLICADFVGPLPRTSHGNSMLLVLFDNFSKWVELIPLRKATAEGVVKALRERIVARYGVPKQLITDNGTQFTSRVLKKYLEEIGVTQQFTAPYTPQENPTERANRTIKTIIAQFSNERHNRWDELLPEVMLAINTSTSESTGYSPAFLTQGRNPRLPKALYDEVTTGTGARCLGPDERATELKEIFKIVRRNLEKAFQKQRQHYNLRRRSWKPKIDDYVLVRQHPLSKAVDNFAAKLAPKFKGPYIVTGFISPVIVKISSVENSEKRTAHLSEIKPYYPNNHLFSILPSRSPKLEIRRNGERMDTTKEKFEQSRERFRQNMKRQQAKTRRTIFLHEDELPTTSQQARRKEKKRYGHKAECQRPKAHIPTTTQPSQTTYARNFRMKVISSPKSHCNQTSPHKAADDIITLSDDDEIAPPPPPAKVTTLEPHYDDEVPPPPPPFIVTASAPEELAEETIEDQITEAQTPPPPSWYEECATDTFDLTLEDLSDPIILEFYRSFLGEKDTTVDLRPITPPSPLPPRSPSSLDWENENFHPPTPPRRRGFGVLDVTDNQYSYLGMRCYERVWRAKILVPIKQTTPALCGPASLSSQPQSKDEAMNWGFSSPQHQNTSTVPTTPGRGWLGSTSADHDADTPEAMVSLCKFPGSPLSKTSLPDNPRFDLLPTEIQLEILQKGKVSTDKRKRFIHEILGKQYRVHMKSDGNIKLTLLHKET